ncbi:hypothetical protein [Cupriavidus oxalaticus]|uniref:Uncharacterized protein n=1 Tax=Cupriavidus oxalaticus TaxID=96344 RepID=A0A976BFT4_9BURK|nr:hypothetical protein [Cupriavidus oxalaticus]QRQ86236.1 hypothetical protein JTE91_23795 [Cupriavidus oxalaticus]QRQ95437.1 hypothetical protein JTE92_18465 [Cupriavidus oxalaticus]WQD84096.1 hypothetical protein U0036_06175 [Cupriavidus oxalaticus]SPC17413.1 hypothetical protein CO2235_90287 [Cupriavidus oxalaticus]
MHDRDLFFAVLGVIVFLGYLVFGGVPIYERLTAGINAIHAIMQTANHAGEDRAGRVR